MADDALHQANALIASQAAEIERLRAELDAERLARDLRDWLTTVAVAGEISLPGAHSRLLEMIVTSAAHVISAESGALLLVDPVREELSFDAAIGPKADEVRKLRIPLGHGIAGLVAVSGQPMAISDAGNDPRQASDVAQTVGYVPQSILCVPLIYDEQVIGVLELLDKRGASSFSPEDIDQLSLFAEQAAVAIEQSRAQRNLTVLVSGALSAWASGGQSAISSERIEQFTRAIEQDATFLRAIDLARLVNDVAAHGNLAADACGAILRAFVDFLHASPRTTPEMSDIEFNFGGGR